MKIATWNVNSIKVRLEHLIKWMDLARIDAVVLQETKTVDELFPLAELQAAGFDAVFLGQKTYNGVALVTRKNTIRSVSDVVYNIPGYPDEQKRMIAADIEHDRVPIHVKRGGDLRRQGQRLDAGAGIVRGDETNLFLLHELAALSQAEVSIDQVQVNEFCLSGFSRFKSKIQRKLTLAAAVVADHNVYLFQNKAPPLEGYSKCANGY